MFLLLLFLQVRFWQELGEVRTLRELVDEQSEENEALRARNEALAAEVIDLREGLEAIEERARSELGLVGEDEEFILIVDPEEEARD